MNEKPAKSTPLLNASIASCVLSIIKFVAYMMSGSLVVLASVFDSLIDSIISFINNKVQTAAREAPDKEHPFGHGGIEVLTTLLQGFLFASFGLILVFQSIQRLVSLNESASLESLPFAVAVLLLSAFGGLGIQWYLGRHEDSLTAAGERSLSLKADKAHYLGDFWVNISAAIGVGLVWFTEIDLLDPVFGLVGAAFLLKISWTILRQSLRDILHTETDQYTQNRIIEIVQATDPLIKGVHDLRTRELGPTLFVDFHLEMPDDISLRDGHGISHRIKENLKKEIPRIDVSMHLDVPHQGSYCATLTSDET